MTDDMQSPLKGTQGPIYPTPGMVLELDSMRFTCAEHGDLTFNYADKPYSVEQMVMESPKVQQGTLSWTDHKGELHTKETWVCMHMSDDGQSWCNRVLDVDKIYHVLNMTITTGDTLVDETLAAPEAQGPSSHEEAARMVGRTYDGPADAEIHGEAESVAAWEESQEQ
jgi:hypothetical protein